MKRYLILGLLVMAAVVAGAPSVARAVVLETPYDCPAYLALDEQGKGEVKGHGMFESQMALCCEYLNGSSDDKGVCSSLSSGLNTFCPLLDPDTDAGKKCWEQALLWARAESAGKVLHEKTEGKRRPSQCFTEIEGAGVAKCTSALACKSDLDAWADLCGNDPESFVFMSVAECQGEGMTGAQSYVARCEKDPCEVVPDAPTLECKVKRCKADSSLAECQPDDPCVVNPQAAGCQAEDPCAENPHAAGCQHEEEFWTPPSGTSLGASSVPTDGFLGASGGCALMGSGATDLSGLAIAAASMLSLAILRRRR